MKSYLIRYFDGVSWEQMEVKATGPAILGILVKALMLTEPARNFEIKEVET